LRQRKNLQNSTWYFTTTEENFVNDFKNTNDEEKRKQILTNLYPLFIHLAKGIYFTYKFNNSIKNETASVMIDDCAIHLISCLEKFDASKDKKAFSYFSSISKNYFIQQSKKEQKQEKTSEFLIPLYDKNNKIKYDAIQSEEQRPQASDYIYEVLKQLNAYKENLLIKYGITAENMLDIPYSISIIDGLIKKRKHNKNLLLVTLALIHLFENYQHLEILSKKGILIYLKELTQLNTVQISSCLKKLKIIYSLAKNDTFRKFL